MSRIIGLFLLAVLIIIIGGCINIGFPRDAGVPNVPLGFITGFFHGWIIFISFLYSVIFDNTVSIYARQATSAWYDFGYIIGVGGIAGYFGLRD
jgi:hypothetical protein